MSEREEMMNYCGYPSTIKYIKADLLARGLSEVGIEWELSLMRFACAAHAALEARQEIDKHKEG